MFSYREVAIPCLYHDYCYLSRPAGTKLPLHQHDYFQIIHVVRGELLVTITQGQVPVPPGYLHVLPPGFTHALHTPSGYTQFGLNLRADVDERGWFGRLSVRFATPAILPMPLPPALLRFLAGQPPILDEMTQLELIHTLDAYCLDLLRVREGDEQELRKTELLAYLELHKREALTVGRIASDLSISRAGLQRLCALFFGCGARTLHERLRIEAAAEMLRQNQTGVSECARYFGYSDIYTFSRVFKRLKKNAPSRYRCGFDEAGGPSG